MLSPHSKTTRRVLGLALPAVLVAFMVLFLVVRVPVPATLSDVGHAATAPLWKARESVRATVVATYESLEGTEALVSDNAALRNELSIMRRENFAARGLERENARLKALLGRGNENPVTAAVINDERYAPHDSFVLDRGSAQGVEEGMVVTTAEGVALGTIVRVLTESSVASQFSAPDLETSVVVEASSTSLQVPFTGQGAGTLVFRAPRDLAIHEGDLLTLPSFNSYPLGEVVFIDSAPEEAHKTVYARQSVRPSEVRYVLIHAPSAVPATTSRGVVP